MSIPDELKPQINSMIRANHSDRDIAFALAPHGLNVPASAVGAYRASIAAPAPAAGAAGADDDEQQPIDTSSILEQYLIERHGGIARERMLETMLNNQLAIVLSLQSEYIAGNAPFPHDAIRALKEIQSLFDSTKLKALTAKEIESRLQDEKINTMIERYRAQGHIDGQLYYESSGNSPSLNDFEFNEAELSLFNLTASKQKASIAAITKAYKDAFISSTAIEIESE